MSLYKAFKTADFGKYDKIVDGLKNIDDDVKTSLKDLMDDYTLVINWNLTFNDNSSVKPVLDLVLHKTNNIRTVAPSIDKQLSKIKHYLLNVRRKIK